MRLSNDYFFSHGILKGQTVCILPNYSIHLQRTFSDFTRTNLSQKFIWFFNKIWFLIHVCSKVKKIKNSKLNNIFMLYGLIMPHRPPYIPVVFFPVDYGNSATKSSRNLSKIIVPISNSSWRDFQLKRNWCFERGSKTIDQIYRIWKTCGQ